MPGFIPPPGRRLFSATSERKQLTLFTNLTDEVTQVVTLVTCNLALFVSRFSPEITAEDVHESLKEQLSLKKLTCTRLKTKFNSYASFHISKCGSIHPLPLRLHGVVLS
jgi:hypothetical protein